MFYSEFWVLTLQKHQHELKSKTVVALSSAEITFLCSKKAFLQSKFPDFFPAFQHHNFPGLRSSSYESGVCNAKQYNVI